MSLKMSPERTAHNRIPRSTNVMGVTKVTDGTRKSQVFLYLGCWCLLSHSLLKDLGEGTQTSVGIITQS